MRKVSNTFRKKMNNGDVMYNSCTITLVDGTELKITPDDITMGGVSVSSATSNYSSFDIGGAIIGEAKIKLINHDKRFSNINFEGAKVTRLCSFMQMDEETIESVEFGVYTVVEQDFNNGIVTLTCYDNLFLFDGKFNGTNGTARTIITQMATDLGVSTITNKMNNPDMQITIPTDSNYSFTNREMLSYILQITGNFAKCDELGRLVIGWYNLDSLKALEDIVDAKTFTNPSTDLISAGLFADMGSLSAIGGVEFEDINDTDNISILFNHTLSVADVIITGVKVMDSEGKTYVGGTDGYMLVIDGNPLVKGNEQAIANALANIVVGMRFRPMSIQTLENPLVESGDVCLVLVDNIPYMTIFTNISYTIGANTTLDCGAESTTKTNSDRNSIATQVAKQQVAAFSDTMTALTNLMSMSFGVFKTEERQEDGSIIYYMHNKPELENSSTIWKMTANTFTVSTDGGETWNAGIDSSGNALVNVLSAVGVKADWIEAGTITGKVVANDLTIKGGSVDVETSAEQQSKIILRRKSIDGDYGEYFFPEGIRSTFNGYKEISGSEGTRRVPYSYEVNFIGDLFQMTRTEDGVQANMIIQPNMLYTTGNIYIMGTQTFTGDTNVYGNAKFYGNVYNSSGGVVFVSDKNKKNSIENLDIDNTSEFVYSLKPCKFKYNNGTSDRYHHGLIAQEVKESMGTDDWGLYCEYVDETTNDNTSALRYDELIADLIATVQSQNKRIETLEKKLLEV